MAAEYFLVGSTKLRGQFWYETRAHALVHWNRISSEKSLNKSVPYTSESEDPDDPDGVHDAQAIRVVNWTTRETIAGASVDAVRQRVVDERQAREAREVASRKRDTRREPVLVPQVR